MVTSGDSDISEQKRVSLIREGNACYNRGDIERAKGIFLKTGYTGGLIKVADYYYQHRKPAAALLLYRAAGCESKVEELYGQVVAVIRQLLEQDRQQGLIDKPDKGF